MTPSRNRDVLLWMLSFSLFVVALVVYGGFVRLTRSGLSIVEWNPVSGAIPPLTHQAWQDEFSKYQATPEYLQINIRMTLSQYQEIFLIEWFHRILARLAGLVYFVPFLIFLTTGKLRLKESGIYILIGCLFMAQALMGWIMVASGLVNQPSVSQFALAAHLFLALALIGISAWSVLDYQITIPLPQHNRGWSRASITTLVGLVVLFVQIAYGAFTAGLKGGYVSDSWPLMLGRWIPQGMLSQVEPVWLNLFDAPLTVAFIHRWFAFFALVVGVGVFGYVRSETSADGVRRILALISALSILQISLGIAVVVSRVEIVLALLHQLNALFLFVSVVYLLHQLRMQDNADVPGARP